MNILIEAKGISKQFHRDRGDSNIIESVKQIDISFQKGELVLLSGYSGSGKTTLLNMLAGILEPTTGNIFINGKDIYSMSDGEISLFRNQNIGNIPQGQTAIHSLTVLENILLPFTMYQKDNVEYEKKKKLAEELLEKLQILSLKNVMPSELSGGELRRVCVARALIMEPTMIFADEPTSDLDEKNTEIVMELLKNVAMAGNLVVISTHDKTIIDYATKKYIMNEGALSLDSN